MHMSKRTELLRAVADVEDDASAEPSLGSTDEPDQRQWARGGCDDLEESFGDDEPSLGSLSSSGGSQSNWAGGAGGDLEEEHDGSEPDEHDEPLLGATEAVNQCHAWHRLNPNASSTYEPEADELDFSRRESR